MATNINVFGRPQITNYRLSGVAREALIIASGMAMYMMVRVLVGGQADAAVNNGNAVIDLERQLGIFWELQVQQAVLFHPSVSDLLRALYVYGHLPVIGGVAVLLYYRAPERYVLLRNAVLLSGAVSLLSYSLFPAAPPRLMPETGFIDTVFAAGHDHPLISKSLMNEYAAMPSLHFGWSVFVALGLWWSTRNLIVRGLALVWPLVMGLTIVATANHYLLDAAGGLVAVVLGLAIAIVLTSPSARRRIACAFVAPDRRATGAVRPSTSRREVASIQVRSRYY